MSDIPGSGNDPLKEVVERMKREAYGAGWRAAIEAMSAALASLASLAPPEGEAAEPSPTMTVTFTPKSAAADTSLPTVGTTPWYVMQAVQKKQGMTGAQVIEAVRAEGHTAGEPQIRTALSRLERRQILANRHRKWFLK